MQLKINCHRLGTECKICPWKERLFLNFSSSKGRRVMRHSLRQYGSQLGGQREGIKVSDGVRHWGGLRIKCQGARVILPGCMWKLQNKYNIWKYLKHWYAAMPTLHRPWYYNQGAYQEFDSNVYHVQAIIKFIAKILWSTCSMPGILHDLSLWTIMPIIQKRYC